VLIAAGAGIGMLIKNATAGRPAPTPSATVTAAPVPNVAGMSESDARSAIEGAGLKFVKGDDVASDTVDAGKAVSSDPGAGASVLLGGEVTVHFSSGSAMVEVPDVTGLSQSEARSSIEGAGLVWGDVLTEDSASTSAGRIIRTDPGAGASVGRGETVSVVISSGRTTVPQITNLESQEAQAAITAAGLTYNSSTVEATTTDSTLDGKYVVTAVNPAEGTSLEIGSAVNITVTHYTLKAQPTASATPTQQQQPEPKPTKTKEKEED